MKIFKKTNFSYIFLVIFAFGLIVNYQSENQAQAAKTSLPLKQLQIFSEVYSKIKHKNTNNNFYI